VNSDNIAFFVGEILIVGKAGALAQIVPSEKHEKPRRGQRANQKKSVQKNAQQYKDTHRPSRSLCQVSEIFHAITSILQPGLPSPKPLDASFDYVYLNTPVFCVKEGSIEFPCMVL
jgi:hypothetical protein